MPQVLASNCKSNITLLRKAQIINFIIINQFYLYLGGKK